MAKKTIANEIAAAIQAGATVVADNKFTNPDGTPLKVRSMESTYDPLEVGDVLTIPTDYTVLAVKFSDAEDAKAYPCIYVEVKSADGSERNFRFFPNSLCKSVTPIVEGKRGPKVKTKGTASELYRTVENVDDGLALLKGKRIRVSSAEIITVRDFNTQELRDTHIYTYDLEA